MAKKQKTKPKPKKTTKKTLMVKKKEESSERFVKDEDYNNDLDDFYDNWGEDDEFMDGEF